MAALISSVKPDEKEVYSTTLRIYSWTPTTFIKREVPPKRRQKNQRGEYIIDPFVKELFQIEASALNLLSQTKIKVPKLVDSGPDENGLAFIETKLWGASLARVLEKNAGCQTERSMSMPENVQSGRIIIRHVRLHSAINRIPPTPLPQRISSLFSYEISSNFKL
jgi:hypothetical protein